VQCTVHMIKTWTVEWPWLFFHQTPWWLLSHLLLLVPFTLLIDCYFRDDHLLIVVSRRETKVGKATFCLLVEAPSFIGFFWFWTLNDQTEQTRNNWFKLFLVNSNWLFYSSKNQTKPKILIPNLNCRGFVWFFKSCWNVKGQFVEIQLRMLLKVYLNLKINAFLGRWF
jgi:hypothetical protein